MGLNKPPKPDLKLLYAVGESPSQQDLPKAEGLPYGGSPLTEVLGDNKAEGKLPATPVMG